VTDLERYCDVRVRADGSPVVLMSTAYVGEEMRFTGEGVSMPGSAAVSGRASVEQVHRMESRTGLRFGDRLPALLERLREAECAGEIRLHNRFAERAAEELLDACFEPTDFFTPHTYERHVEQGPQLSRAGVPAVVVDTIMGLRQEDLVLTGERCEAAALELVCRLRDLTDEERYQHTRISVGVVQPLGEAVCHRAPALALRLSLVGRKSHAGAMPTADRRDAGVAAGRVVRALDHWLGEHDPDCVPLVGDVSVDPSVNRNVGPDRARLTLALPEADRGPGGNRLVQILQGFVVGALTADVASGGEGIEIGGIERVSFVNTAKKVRVSLDLRDACADTLRRLRGELEDVLADVGAGYGVSFEASIEQQMAPQHLAETGQVLVLERTYGGGHNPEETELMEDLTSGTLLALAVAMDVLGRGSLDGCDLVAETTRRVPSSWREALAPFVSGLLPDTANTAAAVRERRARTG